MRDGELPFAGETQIFITPGYRIRSVDAMVTNFHLPESTLLMMISAFAGKERVSEAYRHAIEQRYRFFSYGDAMLLFPQAGVGRRPLPACGGCAVGAHLQVPGDQEATHGVALLPR